jgi:hypothetical protein
MDGLSLRLDQKMGQGQQGHQEYWLVSKGLYLYHHFS